MFKHSVCLLIGSNFKRKYLPSKFLAAPTVVVHAYCLFLAPVATSGTVLVAFDCSCTLAAIAITVYVYLYYAGIFCGRSDNTYWRAGQQQVVLTVITTQNL